ncbi:MAG: tRNA dihydrouridine synthase DusB [Verrucomicrobiota bacterium]
MLPWFQDRFPLFLAPMAGVTDTIFRALCKEQGADVMVTEFVSAEGIFRKNARTMEYLDFTPAERPLGVQLFGADPEHLGEAARMVRDWVQPDFLDLNFGCPVNKVVSRNGGSALLKDHPLMESVARAVVQAAGSCPVTAKIRIGWSRDDVNALTTARILEDAGIQALAVHGRTKDMGYSGEADWNVIDQVARSVRIPVIGNGDIHNAHDAARRKRETAVAGLMVGRGAMSAPWVFHEIKCYLATGELPPPPPLAAQWELIRRHCVLAIAARGAERPALHSLRARLMAYTHGMPHAKILRGQFANVESLAQLDDMIAASLADAANHNEL